MSRYFVHDLESEKLHVFTGGKADWLTIPEADRDVIKRACLWSNRNGCWVSRRKGTKGHILAGFYPSDVLSRNGFEDRGTEGEKLSFAEKIEAKQERAEARAERAEERADRATKEGHQLHDRAHDMASIIPFGQPILVGHHSEKRDRRYREKIHNTFSKAFESLDKAKHYEGRAETARATAEGAQYSDPGFLGRRIAEQEAEERLLLRRQAETTDDEYRTRLEGLLEEVRDKLGFYRHCLETCGVKTFDRAALAGKKFIFTKRRGWEQIVRLNPKTVSVCNTCFSTEELQKKYALKRIYAEITDAR